ncbi:hypothetical protein [Bacillus sp. Marseille-P3661]|uniref:hypothetical protein n=1 Tax=Bacillus sp. Marseille-P3661 TaxID=1936234 RepID=UPI0015E1679C|nr:hypothetical protein [Bacillus sp. Marseille-P3661]
MGHDKDENIKLSYESDGIMGQEDNGKDKQAPKKDAEFAEEFFFNTTQNSE